MIVQLVLVVSLFAMGQRTKTEPAAFTCPEAIFCFGDSTSDTGNAVAVGYAHVNYPYEKVDQNFDDQPGRNRFCDGRLIIDFVGKLLT